MLSVLRRSPGTPLVPQKLWPSKSSYTFQRKPSFTRKRLYCFPLVRSLQRPLTYSVSLSANLGEELFQNHPASFSPDTIYALSTAPGQAAIAVIRISGPGCLQIYQRLCPGRPLPQARAATVRKLYDPASLASAPQVLDSEALLLYFPAPKTVTGEDVLELHTHGGPAIVKAVLDAITSSQATIKKHSGAYTIRYAEPGEFTKRAFYNNRLDLTQIEALGDALSAETEQQRRLAVSGVDNELGARYGKWRNLLLAARGELEALIDFSEDQHLDASLADFVLSISKQVRELKTDITLHVKNASKGELMRNGISIAVLGAPNAGKSSLLNRIVGREAAIVSSEQGTTRDIVDVDVDIGGWLCRLGDMAGLRKAILPRHAAPSCHPVGAVEKEGMRRAKARALASDVVLVMLSLEDSTDHESTSINVDEELLDVARECERLEKPMIVVINKIDKMLDGIGQASKDDLIDRVKSLFPHISEEQVFLISCLEASHHSPAREDPGNIQHFLHGLELFFTMLTTPSGSCEDAFEKSYWEQSLSVSHRQREHLRQCLRHLEDFLPETASQYHPVNQGDLISEIGIVAAAEHLRFAADCLAKITGRGEAGDVEDVLGVVFEK